MRRRSAAWTGCLRWSWGKIKRKSRTGHEIVLRFTTIHDCDRIKEKNNRRYKNMSLEGKMKSGRLYCEFGHELEENKAYEQKIQYQRVHCKELVYDCLLYTSRCV